MPNLYSAFAQNDFCPWPSDANHKRNLDASSAPRKRNGHMRRNFELTSDGPYLPFSWLKLAEEECRRGSRLLACRRGNKLQRSALEDRPVVRASGLGVTSRGKMGRRCPVAACQHLSTSCACLIEQTAGRSQDQWRRFGQIHVALHFFCFLLLAKSFVLPATAIHLPLFQVGGQLPGF